MSVAAGAFINADGKMLTPYQCKFLQERLQCFHNVAIGADWPGHGAARQKMRDEIKAMAESHNVLLDGKGPGYLLEDLLPDSPPAPGSRLNPLTQVENPPHPGLSGQGDFSDPQAIVNEMNIAIRKFGAALRGDLFQCPPVDSQGRVGRGLDIVVDIGQDWRLRNPEEWVTTGQMPWGSAGFPAYEKMGVGPGKNNNPTGVIPGAFPPPFFQGGAF